jgi:hypothetical protein
MRLDQDQRRDILVLVLRRRGDSYAQITRGLDNYRGLIPLTTRRGFTSLEQLNTPQSSLPRLFSLKLRADNLI